MWTESLLLELLTAHCTGLWHHTEEFVALLLVSALPTTCPSSRRTGDSFEHHPPVLTHCLPVHIIISTQAPATTIMMVHTSSSNAPWISMAGTTLSRSIASNQHTHGSPHPRDWFTPASHSRPYQSTYSTHSYAN
jgi:hypothetical protein